MRPTGNVGIIRADIQEERFVLMSFNEADGIDSDTVCDIFIFPQSLLATFHVTDTGNTVHDSLVMPVVGAWFEFGEQFGVVFAQRFTRGTALCSSLRSGRSDPD